MFRFNISSFILLSCFTFGFKLRGSKQVIPIPYIQDLTHTSARLAWEESRNSHSILKWGHESGELNYEMLPQHVEKQTMGKNRIKEVLLVDLQADTTYYYQLLSPKGDKTKEFSFKTLKPIPESYYFLAMSDAQHGKDVSQKVIEKSVMKHAFTKTKRPSFVLFAGDLVQNGDLHENWLTQWFQPLKEILPLVPVYPAIGNHEKDHRLYFNYFHLPENGSSGFKEHWYFFDYGPVRFISLDTNKGYRVDLQLNWLENVLSEVSQKDNLSFVVAYFHHPHHSEAWLPGETDFSGRIQQILERFSLKTNKPSVHFCGHTHGYSRGHSFQSRHIMMNVAALGGAIDDWGDYKQKDYPEYVKSLAEFGWLKVSVSDGNNPSLMFERYGFGNDKRQLDTGIRDHYKISLLAPKPDQPNIKRVFAKSVKNQMSLFLSLADFKVADASYHLSTQVQMSADPLFKELLYDQTLNNENWYFGSDKNKSINLEKLQITINSINSLVYLRVRYRSSQMVWTSWSLPYVFNKNV